MYLFQKCELLRHVTLRTRALLVTAYVCRHIVLFEAKKSAPVRLFCIMALSILFQLRVNWGRKCGRKQLRPICKNYPAIWLERLGKPQKNQESIECSGFRTLALSCARFGSQALPASPKSHRFP